MIADRRLAKLEGALSPKGATLLWLAEAHEFGSLPAYVDWLLDQPISVALLERVPTQAQAGALEAMRGQPREVVRDAAHQASRDAIFLVELVLKVNVAAENTIRIAGLRYGVFFWEMRAISAEAELARRRRSRADRSASGIAERWQAWCTGTAALLTGIRVLARRPRTSAHSRAARCRQQPRSMRCRLHGVDADGLEQSANVRMLPVMGSVTIVHEPTRREGGGGPAGTLRGPARVSAHSIPRNEGWSPTCSDPPSVYAEGLLLRRWRSR
jgi:hypothetical protein